MSDTPSIDKLFLELSQFTKAKTAREIELERDNNNLIHVLRELLDSHAHYETLRVTSCGERLDNAYERFQDAYNTARCLVKEKQSK